MKRRLFLMLSLLAAAGLTAAPSAASAAKPAGATVISYNILEGFCDRPVVRGNPRAGMRKGSVRKAEVAAWLKSRQPAIVGLTELNGFSNGSLRAFAKSYGHGYAEINTANRGYTMGITSRYPIEVVTVQGNTRKPWHHGFIHARTAGIDVIVLHLCPFETETRMREVHALNDYIRSHGLRDYLIMGDFNTLSPFDSADIESRPNVSIDPRWLRYGLPDYAVMSALLAYPTVDALRHFTQPEDRRTWPAADGNAHRNKTAQRLDYILVSPRLFRNVTGGWIGTEVPQDRSNFYSDHLPVGITLRLPADTDR